MNWRPLGLLTEVMVVVCDGPLGSAGSPRGHNPFLEQGDLFMTVGNGESACGFADLTLAPAICQALTGLGYEEPTPIQRAAIPPLLAGRDLVGQAATGTGKTAAFALPVLQRILGQGERRPEPLPLVLVPTRELAIHVSH